LGVGLRAHGLGVSFSISTGNEACTGIEDYVEYLIDDEHTRAIAMIIEVVRQPRRFLELLGKAREKGKHVVLLHPGRTSAARQSAATHTGAMTGDYQVMRTMVEHAGACVVDSLEELIDVSHITARCPALPKAEQRY
jgi:acetate---CoA ligase (ADP-forming)